MKRRPGGFTLLEMLVVVGIIAIMLGVGATSYSNAQKKARDARRRSDLKAAQACLEQSYLKNGKYPLTANQDPIPSTTPIDCGGSTMTLVDPTNSTTLGYRYYSTGTDANGTAYVINAKLETETAAISVSSQQ